MHDCPGDRLFCLLRMAALMRSDTNIRCVIPMAVKAVAALARMLKGQYYVWV